MANSILDNSRKGLLAIAFAYGLYLSCMAIVTWGGYCHFLFGEIEENVFLYEHYARELAFAICLISAGISSFFNPNEHRQLRPIIAMILFIMGGMLVLVQQYSVVADPAWEFFVRFSLVLAGFCFGWSSGIICCSLQEILSVLKLYEAGYAVFGAAGLSAIPYFLLDLVPATPLKQLVYFFVAIPTMAAIVHFLSEKHEKEMLSGRAERVKLSRPSSSQLLGAATELWKPFLCITASAFVIGIIRAQSTANSQAILVTNNTYMVAMAIAAIILLVSWSTIYKHLRLSTLHVVLFPITATALLALPMLNRSFQDLATFMAFLAYALMFCLLIVASMRTARVHVLHPVLVYGISYGLVTVGSVLGAACGMVYRYVDDVPLGDLTFIACLAIYILSLVMNMHKPEKEEKAPADKPTSVGTVLKTISQSAPELTLAETQRKEDFETRCFLVVDRYGLSRREAEVMNLIVRGRDVPYIAEELTISKNTVRTHKKNVFSKTNVHSSQELIDLVEYITPPEIKRPV